MQPFNILVVIDPKYANKESTAEACIRSIEWMSVDIDISWHKALLSCKPLKRLVYNLETVLKGKHKSRVAKKKAVLIHEWLYLTASWQLRDNIPLDVEFLEWEVFRDILLEHSPDRRNRLKAKACAVIGGIDLALEIDLPARGLEEGRRDLYIARLKELGNEVTLWPHIEEQVAASKWLQVQSLDEIARRVTRTHRPGTTLLTESSTIEDVKGKVLKREGAECSSMVLVPQTKARAKRNGGQLKACNHYPETTEQLQELYQSRGLYRWMVQDFVPYLLSAGEWRVFFCGGRQIFTIHTQPAEDALKWSTTNGLHFSVHTAGHLLSEIRWLMDRNPNWTSDDITEREWGTIEQRAAGMKELHDFAQKTYEALFAKDRSQFSHDFLAMSLWCRLDISIIDVPGENRLDYFVNEVEKFQSTSIFGRVEGTLHPVEHLAEEAAEVLTRFLGQHYEVLGPDIEG